MATPPTRDAFAQFAAWKRGDASSRHADLRRPAVESTSKATSSTKRPRPGAEPRQPDTPYICFWKAERPEVLAEYPNMAGPNVSREVGLRWKALSSDERKLWVDRAAQDRERYEQEMVEYRKLMPTSSEADSLMLAEQPPGPRGPLSAFRCFLLSNRESLALLDMTADVYKSEMRALWRRMPTPDKKLWLDMAARDVERYTAETAKLQPPAAAAHARARLATLRLAAQMVDNAPRAPRAAAEFFSLAKKHPAGQKSDVEKAWDAMAMTDKLPFLVDEQLDLLRFIREMEDVVSANGGVDEPFEMTAEDLDAFIEIQSDLESTLGSASSTVSDESRPGRRAKIASPKKPLTAFNMMYLTKREDLMASYQLTQNECSALCGRLWREMSEDDKLPFVRMAAHDKERYRLESVATRSTRTRSSSATAKERSGSRDPIGRGRVRGKPALMAPLMGTKEAPRSPGFRHYVECKQAEREQWTLDMWVSDWESLANAHRVLWEELANDSSSRFGQRDPALRGEPDEPDLELLFGLARNASPLA